LKLVLPDGGVVPPHYHITEVGHATKRFLDCGGKAHAHEACLLQVWIADDVDHRLKAGKLLQIFERAGDFFPSLEIPVEFEHEAPVLTQLEILNHKVQESQVIFELGLKEADCLAKDVCMPNFSLPAIPGTSDACQPGSGCC